MTTTEKIIMGIIGISLLALILSVSSLGNSDVPNCFNTKVLEMPTYCLMLIAR